jgi:hypothetical protein
MNNFRYNKGNLPDAISGKSINVQEQFIKAANGALMLGKTESEATLQGFFSVAPKPQVQPIGKFLEDKIALQELKKSGYSQDSQKESTRKAILKNRGILDDSPRYLVKAHWDQSRSLVLTFDTGEFIKTEPVPLNAVYQSVGVGVTNIVSSALTSGDDMPYSTRIDFITDDEFYRGESTPGTVNSAAYWRIKKVQINPLDGDMTETWASGNADFNKVWNDRLTYTYS